MQQNSWICLWTVMSFFFSMSRVAGFLLLKKITKHANLTDFAYFKKFVRKLQNI